MAAIGSDLSGFQGDAIEALNGSYLARTSTVIAGQQVLMVALGIVVTGEREVWVRTREDLLEIADSAEAAFLDYAGGGGGGSLKTTFLVLGAVATAATAFTGAGMIVTAAALNAAGTFLPETPAEPELEFAGGSVSEVHGHLLMALSDQCRVIADVERAFADCADAAVASSVDNPDYHDFATPGDPVPFLQAGEDAEYFGPGETLAVHGPELREAAGKVEAVSQVLQHVCQDLPTLSSWSWDRHHVVGYGRYGHHGETQALAQHLEGLLQGSATRMNEVAEKMVLVSYDFEATEQQIADELRQRLAEVPDPTPNQDVEYGHPADAG
ncbi:hypothetical protein [Nocardioides lijunqiniae]|uniref:hypothetical protein n=1 Tax=Nocardioides lijunqiniae TaxID=2760832 RepID=UPI001877EB25